LARPSPQRPLDWQNGDLALGMSGKSVHDRSLADYEPIDAHVVFFSEAGKMLAAPLLAAAFISTICLN
jgi:hypothetical protein